MQAIRWQATLAGAFQFATPAAMGSFSALLLASVGINLLALALPIFILQIYDRVLPNQTGATLVLLGIGLGAALLLDMALRLLRAQLASWNGARFEHLTRCRAVERLLYAPLQRFQQDSTGVHLERVNAVATMREFHASQLVLVLIDLPFALLFLALIAYLGGMLVLVPLLLLLAFASLAALVGKALRHSAAERAEADKQRYDLLLEILHGIHTVKALALNARLQRRQEARQEDSALALRRVMYQNALAQTLGGLFSQINLVTLVAAGALCVLDGSMTMGALAACTLLSGRALQPLQAAMGLWTSFQGIRVAQSQVEAVMAMPDERPAGAARPPVRGALELRGVCFAYQDGQPLLDQVSLTVQPGEMVAIEGDTGSGKSTLLMLIQRLLLPGGGEVLLDGASLDGVEPAWLRAQVALLPQRGAIYAGTVLENLTSFRAGEVVNQALTLAYLLGVDEAVKRMPQGFDSRIGVGEVLPAGLRQRIAIIRELVKQPAVILFDDADHALDAASRERLLALLRQLAQRAVVVVVSDNPALLQAACRRYRLAQGQLFPLEPHSGKVTVQEVTR